MLRDTLSNLDKIERITALLAAKEKLSVGAENISEQQWVLDALQLLLEAERESLLVGSLLSRKP